MSNNVNISKKKLYMWEKLFDNSFLLTILLFIVTVGLYIGQIQIYQYMLLLTLCFCSISFFRVIIVSKTCFNIWIVLVIIFAHTTIVNIFQECFQMNYFLKMIALVILSLGLSQIRSEQISFKRYLFVMQIAVAISCFIAIGQSLQMEWAINVWIDRYFDNSYRSNELLSYIRLGRAAGVTTYSLDLGFQIVQIFPFCILMISSEKTKKASWMYYLLFVIVLGGCVSTGTRMALLVCLFQLLVLFVLKKKFSSSHMGKIVFMGIVSLLLIIILSANSSIIDNIIIRFMEFTNESNSANDPRIVTYLHYIKTLFNMSPINWIFVCVYGSMNLYKGANTLGSGHNMIVSGLFEFGIIGIILLVLLYSRLLRYLFRFKEDLIAKSIGFGIIGYLITSLTNDSCILFADFFHILFLIIAIGYVEYKEKKITV